MMKIRGRGHLNLKTISFGLRKRMIGFAVSLMVISVPTYAITEDEQAQLDSESQAIAQSGIVVDQLVSQVRVLFNKYTSLIPEVAAALVRAHPNPDGVQASAIAQEAYRLAPQLTNELAAAMVAAAIEVGIDPFYVSPATAAGGLVPTVTGAGRDSNFTPDAPVTDVSVSPS